VRVRQQCVLHGDGAVHARTQRVPALLGSDAAAARSAPAFLASCSFGPGVSSLAVPMVGCFRGLAGRVPATGHVKSVGRVGPTRRRSLSPVFVRSARATHRFSHARFLSEERDGATFSLEQAKPVTHLGRPLKWTFDFIGILWYAPILFPVHLMLRASLELAGCHMPTHS
jgi:hypothetical protein